MPLVRLRMWWEGAFWVIPVLGVLAGWLLDYASVYVDEWIFGISDVRGVISPSAQLRVPLLAW